ncbi:hypothetical protein, partial [Anaerosolibacter sp.]|uniref:hypothetical protein n=1 Tax=Anaerosolibacter sp. TaxID=1872527 RepID=UPI0039F137AF
LYYFYFICKFILLSNDRFGVSTAILSDVSNHHTAQLFLYQGNYLNMCFYKKMILLRKNNDSLPQIVPFGFRGMFPVNGISIVLANF